MSWATDSTDLHHRAESLFQLMMILFYFVQLREHLLELPVKCSQLLALHNLLTQSWASKLNQTIVLQQSQPFLVSLFLALLERVVVGIIKTVGLLQCFYLESHPGALPVLRIHTKPLLELKLLCDIKRKRRPDSKYIEKVMFFVEYSFFKIFLCFCCHCSVDQISFWMSSDHSSSDWYGLFTFGHGFSNIYLWPERKVQERNQDPTMRKSKG